MYNNNINQMSFSLESTVITSIVLFLESNCGIVIKISFEACVILSFVTNPFCAAVKMHGIDEREKPVEYNPKK